MWVAKISKNLGKFHDYELSPRFKSIYDCQQYIDNELKSLEEMFQTILRCILENHYYKKSKKVLAWCYGGSFIRCYNLSQKRFANGFDL